MAVLPAVLTLDEAPGVIASVERIDAWMAIARENDRFIYATRAVLPIASTGAKRMRELAERGLVELTRPRSTIDPTVFNYQARRTAKPTPLTRPARARLVAAAVPPLEDEVAVINALMPVLERFARHGRPCPTDRQLAARAELTEQQVRNGLRAMADARLIVVQGCAPPTSRRIIILSTGHITGIAA